MAISDYFGLIPLIFLILIIIEIWRFFSVGGKGEFGAKLKKFKKPGWLKNPWGKEEKKAEEKVEKGREQQAEFSEALDQEKKDLEKDVKKEKTLEDKEEQIDAAEEAQEKEIGKDLGELNKYIGVSRQLAPGDPKAKQYIGAIDWQKKKIAQRLDYIKELEKIREQAEDEQAEILGEELKQIRKERKVTRRKKRYERRDFNVINRLIKKTPAGPKKDELIKQRNQILKDVWGDKTLKSVLRHEKKLTNKKKELVKKEEKASEKRIETIGKLQDLMKKPMKKLTDAETKKIGDYFEKERELGKEEDNIHVQIQAIEKKAGVLRTAQDKINLKFLQEELKEVEKAKKMAGEK